MDKKLSTEDVSKLAKLARLKLTDQEKEKLVLTRNLSQSL